MKCFDGKTELTVKKMGQVLKVYLTGSQVNQEEVEYLQEFLPFFLKAEGDFSYEISYALPNRSLSLQQRLEATVNKLEKLQLAQSLQGLDEKLAGNQLPYIHPENLFIVDNRLYVIHSGLKGSIEPQVFDRAHFLTQYRALLLAIFYPKISYERFLGAELGIKEPFGQQLAHAKSIDELDALVNEGLIKEKEKVNASRISVPKGRYRFFKYIGSISLASACILTFFVSKAYHTELPKSQAIITAQADYLTNNYAQTQADLKNYKLEELPKSARFILASSSVNLSDLSLTQKQTVLNNLSVKTDDNTLNYWAFLGQGEFEKSLNLAQNIGDIQLTLLAYTNLYQSTKLNTNMDGAKKQQLLEEYTKKINELSKQLEK